MSIVRINKTDRYTVMSNYHFWEKKMSLKAKGMLSFMLSLPDDWVYSIRGLVSLCKENELAIKNILKELQQFGYLEVKKLLPNKEENRTRIEYVYTVYEKPQEHKKHPLADDNFNQKHQTKKVLESVEKYSVEVFEGDCAERLKNKSKYDSQEYHSQEVDNQPLDNQPLDNQVLQNTKEQNTKEQSTKNNKYICAKESDPLTSDNKKGVNGDKKNKLTDKVLSEEFKIIWDIYYKKKGKAKAFELYKKARKNGTTFEEVKKGVENYNREIHAKSIDSQYIKHADTWFRNRCWEDEYETKNRASYDINDYEKIMDTFSEEKLPGVTYL